MKQSGKKITVIWEEVSTPDAAQRLAAAFTMLFGSRPQGEAPPEQSLDSKD